MVLKCFQFTENESSCLGSILVLISVTGTASTGAIVDLSDFSNDDIRNAIVEKYVCLLLYKTDKWNLVGQSITFVI